MTAIESNEHWRWMPGMRCIFEDWEAPVRMIACDEHQAWVIHENANMPIAFVCDLSSLHTPDFTDAATVGCLKELVRTAWSDPSLCAIFNHEDQRWHVGRWEGEGLVLRSLGSTEIEALISALDRKRP